MPYRRIGKTVEVWKNGKWQKLKTHPTIHKAKKHLAALNINVSKKHRKRK